jgi:hypothetical protein
VREIRARYPNHDPELNAVIGGKYLVHDGRAGLLNLTKVIIRKHISFAPFIHINDHFTKTGSGQT